MQLSAPDEFLFGTSPQAEIFKYWCPLTPEYSNVCVPRSLNFWSATLFGFSSPRPRLILQVLLPPFDYSGPPIVRVILRLLDYLNTASWATGKLNDRQVR